MNRFAQLSSCLGLCKNKFSRSKNPKKKIISKLLPLSPMTTYDCRYDTRIVNCYSFIDIIDPFKCFFEFENNVNFLCTYIIGRYVVVGGTTYMYYMQVFYLKFYLVVIDVKIEINDLFEPNQSYDKVKCFKVRFMFNFQKIKQILRKFVNY